MAANKEKLGILDNANIDNIKYNYSTNYTVLNDKDTNLLYSNVPNYPKTQTAVGNRLVYGNYKEGYELLDKDGNDVINLDPNKIPDNLKDIIGYRIPTEDKYSVLPLRIKGFLNPSEGNSILLPKEITTLTGCDFDGDKFFLMIPSFRKTINGKLEPSQKSSASCVKFLSLTK